MQKPLACTPTCWACQLKELLETYLPASLSVCFLCNVFPSSQRMSPAKQKNESRRIAVPKVYRFSRMSPECVCVEYKAGQTGVRTHLVYVSFFLCSAGLYVFGWNIAWSLNTPPHNFIGPPSPLDSYHGSFCFVRGGIPVSCITFNIVLSPSTFWGCRF